LVEAYQTVRKELGRQYAHPVTISPHPPGRGLPNGRSLPEQWPICVPVAMLSHH